MSTVREMLTKWQITLSGGEQLSRVEQQLESIKHKLDFLAAAEVAKGMFELIERFAGAAEALHLAAANAGITVEELQKLTFAGKQAGISAGEIENAMFRLSKQLYSARKGSGEAVAAFSKIGIGSDQVKGFRTAEDALMAISGRFQHIKDPIEKSALAMQLFGRGGRNMVGFLSEGPDAIKKNEQALQDLGGVLSGPQVEALIKVEHALNSFWALLKGIAGTIAAEMAPVLEYFIQDFIKFFQANRELIQVNIKEWLYTVAYTLGFLWGLFKGVTEIVIKFAKALGIEKNILTIVASVVAAIGVLLVLGTVFSVVGSAIGGLISAWGALSLLAAPIISFFVGTAEAASGLSVLLGSIAEGFAVISGVVATIGEFIAIFGAGAFGAVAAVAVAAIGAIIVALHDAWVLLSGGSIKDTWIGQLGAWIADLVSQFGNFISQLNIVKSAVSGFDSVKKFLGLGSNDETGKASGAISNMATASQGTGFGSIMPDLSGGTSIQGDHNVTISAPINITVPHGTSAEMVGEHVQKGVRDHLDTQMRQAQRSLKPAVAH